MQPPSTVCHKFYASVTLAMAVDNANLGIENSEQPLSLLNINFIVSIMRMTILKIYETISKVKFDDNLKYNENPGHAKL